ncbi:MAG: hypothetical protein GY725_06420 [bacterium]|nr:hypothetical protein [bacterium]
MWGYTARDHATIPSWVAAQLSDARVDDVEVLNRAQSAYNLTQGLATLLLELRRGARPHAVVFLDGVNEVGPVVEGEEPGDIYRESHARRRLARENESTKDLLLRLGGRLRSVQALQSLKNDGSQREFDLDADCREIADYYANLVQIGVALGREFDFKVFFLWQPTLAMSQKKPGPWETRLLAERKTLGANMMTMQRACSRLVDDRLARDADETYFPLHGLFDEVEGDQFLDHFGHVTEEANARIATSITKLLLSSL